MKRLLYKRKKSGVLSMTKVKSALLLCCSLWIAGCVSVDLCPVTLSESGLQFPELTKNWDKAVLLENATVGTLIWQRNSALHFSLDSMDLWDLRPIDNLVGNNRLTWIKEQIRKKTYLPIQQKFDCPYDNNPALPKISEILLKFSLENFVSSPLPEQCAVRSILEG